MYERDRILLFGYTYVYLHEGRTRMSVGKVGRVGNSLVVRIPVELARELDLCEGERVEIARRFRELVIRPVRTSRLEAMLATVPEDVRADEWDTGSVVGAENVE